MDFRILGPLEALDEGRRVALGGSKQRALLAVFLLHANETLSTDRLIDELWGERPPATAAKTVQVYISRLRKALAGGEGNDPAGAVATREHGYELRLDPERLDAHRFERLVARGRSEVAAGRPERAAAALDGALSLWRGPPLADLAYEPFAQREIARLDDLRVAALEQLIEARLALGAHAEVVGQLETLIGEHPYRERLRAQLMLALYRCDRQADALQAYQDARRALVEELGIEPGEHLRELERAILAQDPELHLQVAEEPVAAQPAADSPRSAFVGRERELAELVGGLDDAFTGRGRLFLLVGEPGIGKSRLAEELIANARARGAGILVGRCWEAGGAPAYWPWVQSLRAYVREAEPDALRAQLGAGAADLAQILPELREPFPDLPEPPSLEPEAARFRLFDAAAEFLRNASESRPIVLLLDDLHAADAPSLVLMRFLARQLGSSRLLLLGAYRDVDPIPGQPLTEMLVEVAREPATRRLPIGGLSERDVVDYIELSTGVPAPTPLARAIHAETEGNPLFVTELVRLLDAEGRIAQADTHLRIPQGVRAVIAQRVGKLSERCRNVLVAASVMGREFGLDALAQLGQMPRDELLDVLDEAMAERVLGDVPGSPGRLRFGHALIRDTLYDELSSARRLQLHRNAAEALETVYTADLDAHLAELAHHFLTAAPVGVADKALDYARRAGDRAAAQLAYEEAVRLYEMALTLVGDGFARCELLLVLGDAQARGGDTPAAQQSFRQAADLAEALGLPEQLARAALGYGGRIIWEVSRGDVHHVPLLERALVALGQEDSPLRVGLLARLAGGPLRDASFPPERKRSLSQEALEIARRIGDPATLAYALSGYMAAHHSPEFTPQQVTMATELVELATETGDQERAAEGHESRAGPLIELGDMRGAKADFAAMAQLAEELRQPSQDWLVAVDSALVALLQGELAEAERLIAGARRLAERVLSWNAAVSHGLQLYALRREQGRLEEVEDLVRRSAEKYPTYPIWRCVRARMASELGYTAEAREALEALAADGFAGLPFDEEWLVSLGLLAETATTLGDVERAADLYQRLLPYSDRVAVCYLEISIGAVARYLGLSASTMERWDDAERHFGDALRVNERVGARPWLARTQEDYARMLLARATPGDQDRALQLLADARSNYRELGMDAWAQRASVQPPKGAAPARSQK
jgi:DNA-binding SARP family transcriptional activator/tetratricopeptide (TPR) repeat protein